MKGCKTEALLRLDLRQLVVRGNLPPVAPRSARSRSCRCRVRREARGSRSCQARAASKRASVARSLSLAPDQFAGERLPGRWVGRARHHQVRIVSSKCSWVIRTAAAPPRSASASGVKAPGSRTMCSSALRRVTHTWACLVISIDGFSVDVDRLVSMAPRCCSSRSRLEWRRDGWRKDFEKLGQVIELVEAQNESLDHLLPCLVGPVGLDGSDGVAVIG